MSELIIGVLRCDRPVSQRWQDALNALQAPEGFEVERITVTSPGLEKFGEIAAARNELTDRALKDEVRYIFFLDDDVILPSDGLTKLVAALQENANARVVGGLYRRRKLNSYAPDPYLVWKGDYTQDTDAAITTWKDGEVFNCSGLGGGCMLIDMSIFAQLKPPFFRMDWVQRRRAVPGGFIFDRVTDDAIFCLNVTKAGFDVLAHAGVMCEHERLPFRGLVSQL